MDLWFRAKKEESMVSCATFKTINEVIVTYQFSLAPQKMKLLFKIIFSINIKFEWTWGVSYVSWMTRHSSEPGWFERKKKDSSYNFITVRFTQIRTFDKSGRRISCCVQGSNSRINSNQIGKGYKNSYMILMLGLCSQKKPLHALVIPWPKTGLITRGRPKSSIATQSHPLSTNQLVYRLTARQVGWLACYVLPNSPFLFYARLQQLENGLSRNQVGPTWTVWLTNSEKVKLMLA